MALVGGNIRAIITSSFLFFFLTINGRFSSSTETDVFCLQSIRTSLQDPNNYLTSWDFSNPTEGNLCNFAGIECWHPDENKVLSISLSDMGLMGQFPRGIQNCTSLAGLDLSNNDISGEIPSDISEMIPFVTTLDLSSNAFTGPIPKSLVNCSFLNVLILDHNQLSGEIPPELALLARLTQFNVANNLLSGPIPYFSNMAAKPEMFANNSGLCGGLLNPCQRQRRRRETMSHAWKIATRVFWASFVTFFVGYFLVHRFLFSRFRDGKFF